MALSLEDFFREEFARLAARGAVMSGSVEVGQDAAQEAMARAMDRWPAVSGHESPVAWVCRVMANLLVDRYRSSDAESTAWLRAPSPILVGEPLLDGWAELIAPLPMRQRMVVTLFYGEDLSIDAIASMLDISAGTVKSLLSKGRRTLSERLGEEARSV
ncbi:MAG TPA: sigma-70 family RNA polymerase sigma factor [Ilumatobacteraceae bacterium]|nr:sigma-70 family RNA polymerase sigma factor [Ilumatobacteraceae bacterium]